MKKMLILICFVLAIAFMVIPSKVEARTIEDDEDIGPPPGTVLEYCEWWPSETGDPDFIDLNSGDNYYDPETETIVSMTISVWGRSSDQHDGQDSTIEVYIGSTATPGSHLQHETITHGDELETKTITLNAAALADISGDGKINLRWHGLSGGAGDPDGDTFALAGYPSYEAHTPEPATIISLLLGGLGMAVKRKKLFFKQ